MRIGRFFEAIHPLLNISFISHEGNRSQFIRDVVQRVLAFIKPRLNNQGNL